MKVAVRPDEDHQFVPFGVVVVIGAVKVAAQRQLKGHQVGVDAFAVQQRAQNGLLKIGKEDVHLGGGQGRVVGAHHLEKLV